MWQISQQELSELRALTQQITGYAQEVLEQVNSAVNGTNWQAQATEAFTARWQEDKGKLTELAEALELWSQELNKREKAVVDIDPIHWS